MADELAGRSLVHRAYRAAHLLRRLWWWLRRPSNHGVMAAL